MSIIVAQSVVMELGWEIRHVMMEVFQVEMGVVLTVSLKIHTSAMILFQMRATVRIV